MPRKQKTMAGVSLGRQRVPDASLFGGKMDYNEMPEERDRSVIDVVRFRTHYIPLQDITDNTENRFRITNTLFLERSIEKLGQLQPAIVMPIEKDGTRKYEIKSGSRRFASVLKIHDRAVADKDEETAEKFSKMFCIILPEGATDSEIQAVITETNTTNRQLSISDVFMNFDIIFEKEDDGSYKYIPKGKRKYETASSILKDMGFTFSPASVKDYLSIYTAHNTKIRDCFEKELITKKQALVISRMPDNLQDETMRKFDALSTAEFKEYIKAYIGDKSASKNAYMKGADLMNTVSRLKKSAERTAGKKIIFADEMQMSEAKKQIAELQEAIETLLKAIDNSGN